MDLHLERTQDQRDKAAAAEGVYRRVVQLLSEQLPDAPQWFVAETVLAAWLHVDLGDKTTDKLGWAADGEPFDVGAYVRFAVEDYGSSTGYDLWTEEFETNEAEHDQN